MSQLLDFTLPQVQTAALDAIKDGIIQIEQIKYDNLNPAAQTYFRSTSLTIVYMGICWTSCVWQLLTATELAYKVRKGLHFAVVFETVLAFMVITCSVLNPLTSVNCEVRFWVSIIAVNLGGCCIQSILLYKAYICYDRAKWLIMIGSIINTGYIVLTFLYGTWGKVETYKDVIGNCVMHNLEWPALAKLGLDLTSNTFLTMAFVLVIYRHYKAFGNSLHKTLLSGGLIFSLGVIISNVLTAILISTRAMGGLSADLYSFDWVITSYLLIKQFKTNNKDPKASNARRNGEPNCVERVNPSEESSDDERDNHQYDDDDDKDSYTDDIEKGSFAATAMTPRHGLDKDEKATYTSQPVDVSRKNSYRMTESTLGSSTLTSTITTRRDTKRSTATTFIDSPAFTLPPSPGSQHVDDAQILDAQPTVTTTNSPGSHKIICERCMTPFSGSTFPHHCEKSRVLEDDER